MNLGLFLAIGESLQDLESKGQLRRLLDYNIKKYSQEFEKVFIFSYRDEKIKLPKNCFLVPNKTSLHRYLYGFFLPLIHLKEIHQCHVLRGLQITGGIPCILSKILYKKPFVINYGYNYWEVAKIEGKKFQSILFPIATRIISFLANSVIITSPDLVNNISYIPKRKYCVINSAGVDIKLFKPKYVKSSQKTLKILFIGRFEAQKNLGNLIKAINGLRNKSIKLIFIGGGSLKQRLTFLAKKVNVELKIKSPVNYRRLPGIFARADIFVLPSLIEGNSKILVEAMACGIPVIGTNVEGINQIITHKKTGLLCDISAKSIRSAIITLFDKNLQKKLSQNARRFIEENYDIHKLLEKELCLLKKIAK